MLPTVVVDNVGYGACIDVVFQGHLTHRASSYRVTVTDISDLCDGQLSLRVRFAPTGVATTLARFVSYVISVGAQKKMFRTTAGGVVTRMQHLLTVGNWPVGEFPCYTMRTLPPVAMTKHAIAVKFSAASPVPAVRAPANLGPKSCFNIPACSIGCDTRDGAESAIPVTQMPRTSIKRLGTMPTDGIRIMLGGRATIAFLRPLPYRQMIGTTTSRVCTRMEYILPFRDFAISENPRYPMRPLESAHEPELTITGALTPACPHPTGFSFLDFWPKTLSDGFGFAVNSASGNEHAIIGAHTEPPIQGAMPLGVSIIAGALACPDYNTLEADRLSGVQNCAYLPTEVPRDG